MGVFHVFQIVHIMAPNRAKHHKYKAQVFTWITAMFALDHKGKTREKIFHSLATTTTTKHLTRTLNMEYEINLETMKVRNNIKCTCCHYELSHLNHSKLVSVLLYLNLSMHFDLTDIHLQIPETLKINFQDKSLFLRIAMVIEQRKCL